MINYLKVQKVWFPTSDEIKDYLQKFSKPLNIKKDVSDIILFHYNQSLNNIKKEKLETKCPICNSELVQQSFNENYSRYVCPKFPSCEGHIMNQWAYNLASKGGYRINKFSMGWMDNLLEELKSKNYNISRSLIYKFLKENNLDSPAKIEREMVRKFEGREYNFGEGYKKAKENSNEQEQGAYKKLKKKYGSFNVFYQKFIFYRYSYENYIRHKKPDFLIILPNKIKIVECKLSSWDKDGGQKEDYLFLVKRLFKNKEVEFEYEIKREEGEWS